MYGWRIVTATHIGSGKTHTFEINCGSDAEALRFGVIWFPVFSYSNHKVQRRLGL